MSARQLDADEQRVVDNVREHGCHILYVFDQDEELPDFAYSVGFEETVGQPEVIVFGLKRELMLSMINETHRQCAAGLVLDDHCRVGGLIYGFDCVARLITDPDCIQEHFGWAMWYHRNRLGKPLSKAYQLVWPGRSQGLYPWDEGCPQEVIDHQPALYGNFA